MPFFSVVIPLYNKEHYIKKTIESVLNQSFNDFEIIIVNDGSTDKSLENVEEIKDRRIHVFNQKNRGASSARNHGVEKAKAQWIALLDADDIWYKNHLEELKNCIETLPKAKMVSTGYEIQLNDKFVKKPTFSKPVKNEITYINNFFEYSLIDLLFWTSSLAFKKDKFLLIDGFDVNLKSGQDLDLMIRFALNFKLGYNPKITLLYQRQTENNLSSNINLSEKRKYIDKHKSVEHKHKSFKNYLDINRYSLALQAKMSNDLKLAKAMIADLDSKNLNAKQRWLIALPAWLLRFLKQFQLLLIKMGIYKSAFD